jgi:hypothetical protein
MSLKEAIETFQPWWDNRHYQTLCPERVQTLLSNWLWNQGACITGFEFTIEEVNDFLNQPYTEYRP